MLPLTSKTTMSTCWAGRTTAAREGASGSLGATEGRALGAVPLVAVHALCSLAFTGYAMLFHASGVNARRSPTVRNSSYSRALSQAVSLASSLPEAASPAAGGTLPCCRAADRRPCSTWAHRYSSIFGHAFSSSFLTKGERQRLRALSSPAPTRRLHLGVTTRLHEG